MKRIVRQPAAGLSAFAAALTSLAIGCSPTLFAAQDYPVKPIKLVVTFPAGGPSDASARDFAQLLSQRLNPCNSRCGVCACSCDCEDCCCTAGVLGVLSDSNLSRKATLAAGQLILQGVTLLGTLGNVLVLANDETQRIYFVCAAKVQFLG